MAKKKFDDVETFKQNQKEATEQPITETLEKNYMPYAMTVIVSRAIPDIDGFKPSHRKLLYTMYEMGLLSGARTKSANIVGQTMHLNPHGDASIYDTMMRLTRAHETLLHPFVDSKGSFGKHYSRDMACAASRYTEAKLDPFCHELFAGIEKDAVDFIPNYDNTTEEPTLLPTTFPNILVSANLGIAVGMQCSIPSFNLAEVCDATVAVLKNPETDIETLLDLLRAPDFSGGAQILYDRDSMRKIYETGTGAIRMRAKYQILPSEHCIDILEIPYSATIEPIMQKIGELVKSGKLKEISDVRDAIDLNGFKLTIDLKRDADPELVMKKLFSATDLECNYDCRFILLVNGSPKQLGVKDILLEWIAFRKKCVTRELNFDLKKKQDKLHLLKGLAAILLDIDKAIRIIRNTEKEEDVVPNLAQGFSLSQVQAEYIAEIKLRNLNRQYILRRIEEIEALTNEIETIDGILKSDKKLTDLIVSQLEEIKSKYGKNRRTEIVECTTEEEPVSTKDLFFENYDCRLLLTKGGYLKKLSAQAMKSTEEQKTKEGDFITCEVDTENRSDIMFFTDKGQIYRTPTDAFELTKTSQIGDYVPAKLTMEDDEHVIGMICLYDQMPKGKMIFVFENGKAVRVPMSCYETKSKRKKLSGAFSTTSLPVAAIYEKNDSMPIFIRTENEKGMLIKSALITEKATRTAAGKSVVQLVRKDKVNFATANIEALGEDVHKCRKLVLPSTGVPTGKLNLKF